MPVDALRIPTRAAIYCRISRDREGAGLGVDRQREDCEQLAEQLGLTIHDVYSDNDLSAYSGKPRPDYKRMLDDIRAGRVDVVLSWHTDRLHRSPAELEEYIDVCEPRRVETRTVKAGQLDLSTATGRMIARQLGVQARYEVERMVERQKRTRDQMAAHGKHFGGRRPFGWETDGYTPRSLFCPACGAAGDFATRHVCTVCDAVDEFTADWKCKSCSAVGAVTARCECPACKTDAVPVKGSEFAAISEAAEAVLAGASLRSIAAEWNEHGLPTSTGGHWEGPEVGGMLRRARNAGIVVHRGKEAGPARWLAPLDEATWRSVVAVLDDPDRRNTPGNERKYLGSGLYECGVCGQTMRSAVHGGETKGRVLSYRCRSGKHVSRRIDLLDQYVTLAVIQRVSREDAGDLLAQREDPVDVRGAQRDIREARATLDQLAAALGAGEMDMLEWRAASQAAKKRMADAETLLGQAVDRNPVVGLVGAEDPVAAWNGLGLSRRRAIISYLMTVTVLPARRGRVPGGGPYFDPDAVQIEWKS